MKKVLDFGPLVRTQIFLMACMCLIGLTFSSLSLAQVTTASLRGVVVDSKGEPVEGASVELGMAASQAQKSSVSNSKGEFAFNGLRVGGPYSVTAKKSGLTEALQNGLMLKAGSNEAVTMTLNAAEVIQVVGTRSAPVSRKAYFGASDIKNAPSSSGDPKDIVRTSPDVVVDGQSMSIGGANNRFNSITIDGIRQDDDFGLNANGYPTKRSPISLQSVAEIAVERSPFDVRFGSFLGGNVNIVTKSGTNDFEGSVSTTYASDKLAGKKSKHKKIGSTFSEQRLGFTLGGPIIEDKLHFFVSAEGLKATSPNVNGPAGSGQARVAKSVTAADVARAQDISASVYGFNAGTTGSSLDEDDLKLLAKFDWTISDAHRLEAKYQHATGSSIKPGLATDTRLFLTSNWYKARDTLDTMSLRLFSDWSSALSSKLEVSKKKVVSEQTPLEGNGFMSAEITTADKGSVYLGPDKFRHTNELENESFHVGGELNYLLGDHQLTGGLENDKMDIYNLFVPGSNGVAKYASLDDFAAKKPSELSYTNSVTNNSRDAAANFTYGVTSLYAQDEVHFDSRWTARYGIRSEIYQASENIARNQGFVDRYGFDNTSTVNGKQVLLPRLGVSYKASDRASFRSGVGLYAGGTPNVWLSNNYTNTGVNIDTEVTKTADGFDGRNIPDAVKSRLEAGAGNVDALDPHFNIPQTWKFSLGSNYRFDIPMVADNVMLDFDYTFSKVRYGLLWKDQRRNLASIPNNQPTAVGPDGRDLYDTDTATVSGTDFNPNRGYDILLTNTDKGYGQTASATLSKNFTSGFNVGTSYAWQRVFEVNPGTSSVASSNYGLIGIENDPNNPGLTRSSFERTHRFLVTAGYSKDYFTGLDTSFNLFFERRSGQPYSFTFGGKSSDVGGLFGEPSEIAAQNRMLLYVPRGDGSDVTLDGIDQAAFDKFLKDKGLDKYRGKIAPRNAFTSNWVDVVDARISQELPTYSTTKKARLVFDIKNLPNLMNKNWGQVKTAPILTRAVDVKYDGASRRYVYSRLNAGDLQNVDAVESIWKLQIAAIYEF